MRSDEKVFLFFFLLEKCFLFFYLFTNLFFSFSVGTLGRSHRQNNFQQNQWFANRFWFGCDQPQGRRAGKGTLGIQLIYFKLLNETHRHTVQVGNRTKMLDLRHTVTPCGDIGNAMVYTMWV